MKKHSILFVGILCLLALSFDSCGKRAVSSAPAVNTETVVLKLGHVNGDKTNYQQGMLKVAEEVATATNGRVKIEVYANSQLGNERDMFEGMQLGTIDMAAVVNSVLTSFVPDMAVLDAPFLFQDADHANRVIDGKLGKEIETKIAGQGVHVLGWMESGFRNVFSTRPVQKPSDFKGLKIRTMENKIHMAVFNKLGAIATPMPYGEVFTALQQGTVDAAENATDNVLTQKFYEVTKNVTRTGHVFAFIAICISDKAWAKIPADLKPAVEEAVKKGCFYQRQLLVEANAHAETELQKLGVHIYDIDRAALAAQVKDALIPFKNQMPEQWLAYIEEERK